MRYSSRPENDLDFFDIRVFCVLLLVSLLGESVVGRYL